MRLFVAIPVDDQIKRRMLRVCDDVDVRDAPLRELCTAVARDRSLGAATHAAAAAVAQRLDALTRLMRRLDFAPHQRRVLAPRDAAVDRALTTAGGYTVRSTEFGGPAWRRAPLAEWTHDTFRRHATVRQVARAVRAVAARHGPGARSRGRPADRPQRQLPPPARRDPSRPAASSPFERRLP